MALDYTPRQDLQSGMLWLALIRTVLTRVSSVVLHVSMTVQSHSCGVCGKIYIGETERCLEVEESSILVRPDELDLHCSFRMRLGILPAD